MLLLFWLSLLTLIMIWGGYCLFLIALNRFISLDFLKKEYYPTMTIVLTVHNEEDVIVERLNNLLSLNYPQDLLEVLVASDGSTDKTDALVESISQDEPRVKLLQTAGGGKSLTQNKAIPEARGEIILLTDADTNFDRNIISNLVRNFADPRVGCVSGKLILMNKHGGIAASQGFYWQYETLLRNLESKLGCLHTASGIALAFRKALFRPFENRYGDDCIIPLDILIQGYKVVHEDQAISYDSFPDSAAGELKARIRMTLRNITGTLSRYPLLNPLKFPLISFSIFCHKICRWLTPYFLIILFFSNLVLLPQGYFYRFTFYCQVVFYFLGLIGLVAERQRRSIPLASPIFSFLLANLGFFLGVFKAIVGKMETSYEN